MHATPTETLEALMLAKNATQWMPSRAPQKAMRRMAAAPTRCSRRMSASTAASAASATIDLYHTSGSPPNEMILPNMPVHPARKTAICSRISVRVRVFTQAYFFGNAAMSSSSVYASAP